jgi:YcaO-like protein with predicted kinase domain
LPLSAHDGAALNETIDRLEQTEWLAGDRADPQRTLSGLEIRGLMLDIGATRLAATTLLDRLSVPICYCVRPAAVHPCAIYSSGKGFDEYQARISALFECYERWAAERSAFQGEASHENIARLAVKRNVLVIRRPGRQPPTTCWAFGRNIATGQLATAPVDLVEFPSTNPRAVTTTSGLAAHTTLLGAVRAGYFECLERHYTAHMRIADFRRLSLADFPEHVQSIGRTFSDNDIEIHAFVVASVPSCSVVYAFAYDHWIGAPQMHCSGFAASGSVIEALERSLLEIAQGRAAFVSGLRDDVRDGVAPKGRRVDSSKQFAWLEDLRRVGAMFRPCKGDTAATTNDSFVPSVRRIRERTPAKHPVCFPLRTISGFPAVRVFVPELDDCA